jgi:hypothetical protein
VGQGGKHQKGFKGGFPVKEKLCHKICEHSYAKGRKPRDQPKGGLVQSKELGKDQSKIVKHWWFLKAHLTVVIGDQKVFGA